MTGDSKILQTFIDQIHQQNDWESMFQTAVADCIAQAPIYMEKHGIRTLNDYFDFMDSILTWIPSETVSAAQRLENVSVFYFLFQQGTVRGLQTEISAETTHVAFSWMSNWLISYARTLGEFLDTPASLTSASLANFFASPKYSLNDYIIPGGWSTFNEFFARRIRPECRPIANPDDPNVIVSPADSAYQGSWPIDDYDGTVTFKGISWRISDLLQDSIYKDEFHGGVFLHSLLLPWDYHRMHSPLDGVVLEACVINGQAMLEAIAVEGRPTGNLDKEEGYQWFQTRGLVILDTQIGKMAILPVGMGHIPSVKLSVETGQKLRKGDELAFFQYGGSDIALVFEKASEVSISAVEDSQHPMACYKVGERIGLSARYCYGLFR
ncbi:phosphatidylserine decarboxylase-related protein [Penicillium herquei]|nr:phosphatidylserine decarboxylase-related protein [Penicillium herquei]